MKKLFLYLLLLGLIFIKLTCKNGDGKIKNGGGPQVIENCDSYSYYQFIFHYDNQSDYGVDIRRYYEGEE